MYLLCEYCNSQSFPISDRSYDDCDVSDVVAIYPRIPSFIKARQQWIWEVSRHGIEIKMDSASLKIVSSYLVTWVENHYQHGTITLRNSKGVIQQTFTPDVHLLTESSITKLTIMRDELTALINQLKGTV